MARNIKTVRCPQCRLDFVDKVYPKTLTEKVLCYGYYSPHQCQLCTHRFGKFSLGSYLNKTGADRRQFRRFPVKCRAKFSGDGIIGDGIIRTVSLSGCEIETYTLPKQGAILQLSLRLWETYPDIIVKAAVVRSIRTPNAGLEFLQFDDLEKTRLTCFIQEQLVHSSQTGQQEEHDRHEQLI